MNVSNLCVRHLDSLPLVPACAHNACVHMQRAHTLKNNALYAYAFSCVACTLTTLFSTRLTFLPSSALLYGYIMHWSLFLYLQKMYQQVTLQLCREWNARWSVHRMQSIFGSSIWLHMNVSDSHVRHAHSLPLGASVCARCVYTHAARTYTQK